MSAHAAVQQASSLLTGDLLREIQNLEEIRDWAIQQVGIAEGDRVRIVSLRPSTTGGGWAAYRECLHVGATGTVTQIYFYAGSWRVMFKPDREWSVHEPLPGGSVRRYWGGTAASCPEGMQRADYKPDEDRRHTFQFKVDWLQREVNP